MAPAGAKWPVAASYAVSTTLLLWVAIANGFPMVFGDTGAYLQSGIELHVPPDRPPTYGLAILPFHRLFGMWGIAIAQALFTTWLIDRVLRVASGRASPIWLVGASALLAAATSLAWFVPQIVPDIFTGLVVLIGWLLLFGWDRLARWERIGLPLLLVPIIAFHLTFALILGIVTLAGAALACALLRSTRPIRQAGLILGAIVLALIGLSAINLRAHGVFKPSPANGTFMLHRFLNGHVAQPVIAELCAGRQLVALCKLPRILDPKTPEPGVFYMWAEHPELNAADIRRLPQEEALVIRRTVITRPGSVARMAMAGLGRQMLLAGAGDGMIPYPPEKLTYRQIIEHFPREAPAFLGSLEQRDQLRALLIVPDRAIGLAAALVVIGIFAAASRRGQVALAGLAAMTLVTLIANAFLCSFLSGVFERFQARVMWMPMLVIIAAFATPGFLLRADNHRSPR